MNAPLLEPVRWTSRRWIYAIAGVFAFQALFVFSLGWRQKPAPLRPAFPTSVHLAPRDWAAQAGSNSFSAEDPTLLALPNLRGFSGPAWLQFPPLEYQPGEWSDEPNWLSLDGRSLGDAFAQYLAANATRPHRVSDRPLPPLQRYEPNFPNDPPLAGSKLRVGGILARRPLLATPDLSSWPHSELLSNSVVRVAVGADGSTFSPVLLMESGHPEADLQALKIANDLRFMPVPPRTPAGAGQDELTWGTLVFQWHTLPMPAANGLLVPP